MLGSSQCDFYEKSAGTRYAEHVFLHPVGSVGHVVHSRASGDSTKSIPGDVTLNFYCCIRWDLRVT
jgi:hypothetical protein